MAYKTTKDGKKYYKFEATAENWKPEYTKVLGFVQKRLPDSKISELVGISVSTIKKVRQSPYFQQKLDKALNAYEKRRSERLADIQSSDTTMTKLEQAAQDAAKIVVKALKGDTSITKTQIAVAKDILDRTGYKAVERQEITHHNRDYTPEEIESARATMIEMLDSLTNSQPDMQNYVISSPGSSTIRIPTFETTDDTTTPQDLAGDLPDVD